MRPLDLTGQTFEDVVVVGKVGTDKFGHVVWRCVCKCDKVRYITANYLKAGRTGKCFCTRITLHRLPKEHPLYYRWHNMVSRYQNGRKATGMVSPEWLTIENYIEDVEALAGYENLYDTNYALVRTDDTLPWRRDNVAIEPKWNTRANRRGAQANRPTVVEYTQPTLDGN